MSRHDAPHHHGEDSIPPSELKPLVEYLAKALVDAPDEVHVRELSQRGDTVIHLRVAKPDIGKVVGRQGRTARALRTVVSAAASKHHRRAVLEIDD